MALPPLETWVKVVEVFKVAPLPPPPPETVTSFPITFHDARWLRSPPNQHLTFYYQTLSKPISRNNIISQLKQSLSTTLHHYFPLAGNLTWTPESSTPIIRYLKCDGVSFTVAETDADINRLASGSDIKAVEYHPFVPELSGTYEVVPLIALQVTFFGQKGFSVGYTISHVVADATGVSMFMHAWASTCKEKGNEVTTLKPEHTPFHNRTIIKDLIDTLNTVLSSFLDQNGPNNKSLVVEIPTTLPDLRQGTFVFNRVNIKYIKSSVQVKWLEKYGKQDVVRLTSFIVTIAYVWVCLVKSQYKIIEGLKSDDKFYLGFFAEERAQLEATKASTYFGNCISLRIVEFSLRDSSREDAVAEVAKAIGEAIKGQECEEGVLIKALQAAKRRGGFYTVAGTPRMKLYDVDFGWGRPKRQVMVSIDHNGAIFLTESSDRHGGLEFGIVLNKHEMECFASLFSSGLISHSKI